MNNQFWFYAVLVCIIIFACATYTLGQIPLALEKEGDKRKGEKKVVGLRRLSRSCSSGGEHRFDDPKTELYSTPLSPTAWSSGHRPVERQRRTCKVCSYLEVRYRTTGDVPGPWVLNPMEIEHARLAKVDFSSLDRALSEQDLCPKNGHDFNDPKPVAYCSSLLERFGVFSEHEKPVEVQIRRCKRCDKVDTRYRSEASLFGDRPAGPWQPSVQDAEKS